MSATQSYASHRTLQSDGWEVRCWFNNGERSTQVNRMEVFVEYMPQTSPGSVQNTKAWIRALNIIKIHNRRSWRNEPNAELRLKFSFDDVNHFTRATHVWFSDFYQIEGEWFQARLNQVGLTNTLFRKPSSTGASIRLGVATKRIMEKWCELKTGFRWSALYHAKNVY